LIAKRKNLFKNMGKVSIGTFLSRISGLIRDQVMAILFGATSTIVPDAYYAAFKIPNSLRNLLAEGGMTAAFLPTFKDYLHKDPEDAKSVSSIMFTFLSIILVFLTILGVIFSPEIIKFTTSGFTSNPEKFKLAVTLLRILFPYLYFISITALATAILNSFYRFTIPALTPVLLNLSIIFGAFFLSKLFDQPIYGVAAGILIGGVLQVAIQLPLLYKHKHLFKLNFNFKHPALKKIMILLGPTLFTFSVYEITAIVEQNIASHIESGTISVLYFANRLYQLPLAVFAIALSSALLPALAERASHKDMDGMKNSIKLGIKTILLLSIPSAIFLFILSDEIFTILFQYGKFSARDTIKCADTLKAYSLGLVFISMSRILISSFYALKNTKTPAISSFIALLFFIIVTPILTFYTPLRYLGLPLGTAITTMVNFVILILLLNRKIGKITTVFLEKTVVKTALLNTLFLGTLWGIDQIQMHAITQLSISCVITISFIAACLKISKLSFRH
jgi:putative peptidoglycan lipid II flippase